VQGRPCRPPARTARHAIPLVGGKHVVLEGEFPLTEAAWQGFRRSSRRSSPAWLSLSRSPVKLDAFDSAPHKTQDP
jgi:hypothetical protein